MGAGAYAQNRADFEFLESLAEVEDMIAIDSEVWALMRNPTKAQAAALYAASIRLWFAEHSDWGGAVDVAEIAARHAIDLP